MSECLPSKSAEDSPFGDAGMKLGSKTNQNHVNAAYDLAARDVAVFHWLVGSEPEIVSATGASFRHLR